MGIIGALWFYYKLGMDGVYIPFFRGNCFRHIFHPVFYFRDDGDFYRRSDRRAGRAFRRNFRRYFRRLRRYRLFPKPDGLGGFLRDNDGRDIGFFVVQHSASQVLYGRNGNFGFDDGFDGRGVSYRYRGGFADYRFPAFRRFRVFRSANIFQKISGPKNFQSGPHSSSFSSFRLAGRQGGDAFWVISVVLAMIGMVVALGGKVI